MDPSRISLEDDRRGLSGLAFRFGNRTTYRGLEAGWHVWRVEIFVAPTDELQLVEVDEQGNKSSRQPAPGEMFDALELLSEPGPQTFAALAALVLTGVELRAAGEAAQDELGALLRAAAEDTSAPMPLHLPGDERPLHLSQQGRQVLRQLADTLARDGRAMATLPAVRRLQVSPELIDALHKRVRRQHLQAYRTGDHWFVVLENLPKAPEDESPLLARAEEPATPEHEQPSGSSNGYHRDDAGASNPSQATEEPATEPVMDVAVVTESTLPEVAEAPPETALEPPASSEEAAEAPAVEPPAADEQLAAAEPVAKTVEAEEPAAAAEQSAPEEPLVAQEEPAANEHRTVAGEPEAEEGADTGVPEQAVAEAGQQEQEREQELVAVGAAIAAQAQSTEAGEAPTAGPAPEAGNEELAAEAAVLGSEETAEASAEPAAGPGTPPEEAAPPVTEPSSTRQLFDALSAADQPAEAELLQQLRAEIAFLRQQMREKDRQIAAWITESRRKDLSLTRLENRLRVVPGEHGRARNGTEARASTSDLLAAREQLMAPLAQRLHQLEDRLGSLEASRAPRRPAPWYRRLIGSGSDRQSAS